LLALTMLLARLSTHTSRQVGQHRFFTPTSRRDRVSRVVFLTAFALAAIPFALALLLLSVYALFFAVHGISLLR
jgi:hypothetical protein